MQDNDFKVYGSKEWKDAKGRLVTELEHLSPDVIFLPGWGFPAVSAVLKWCKKASCATVLMSESKKDDAHRSLLKEFIKSQFFVKKFGAALVGGRSHKSYLVELGMPENRIFLGYDIVDNNYFTDLVCKFRSQNLSLLFGQEFPLLSTDYFLVVTRMIPRKNLLNLIKAYAVYRNTFSVGKLDLVICGDGEQELLIKKLIQTLRLENNVHLLGFIPYQKLPLLFSGASALIHPALQEQWGLVINEACASSLPILCSNRVGSAEELVVDGLNGFLFNPNELQDMILAMVKFQQLSQADRIQMGLMSLDAVAAFNLERFGSGSVAAVEAALKMPQG
jgi:glycosyltransferase involved in cell wall biosynthesis